MKMQEIVTIDVNLDAVIRFQQTNDTIKCVMRSTSTDHSDFMVVASDSRIREEREVDLSIIVPTERSPIKCSGRITWYQVDDTSPDEREEYTARISIVNISRMNQRRLDLLIEQKQVIHSLGTRSDNFYNAPNMESWS